MVWGLSVNFYFDSSKVSVFVDAHSVQVFEDTIDVLLCFTEISCITKPSTVNTGDIELQLCN